MVLERQEEPRRQDNRDKCKRAFEKCPHGFDESANLLRQRSNSGCHVFDNVYLSKRFIKTERKGDRLTPTRFGENVKQTPN
jgi:hypothetical protein